MEFVFPILFVMCIVESLPVLMRIVKVLRE